MSFDPETETRVDLFNPRVDSWNEHFAWNSALIVGLTPNGRATASLFNMNEPERVEMRAELTARGEL